MFSVKVNNFLIQSSEDNINKKTIEACKKAYLKNKKWFNRDLKNFTITLSNSEKEFKKSLGKWYSPWAKGLGIKNNIIIRNPKEYHKNYKKYEGTPSFEMLLVHEINHLFATKLNLFKGPYWICEGLAMYTAKQIPGKTYKKKVKFTKQKVKYYLMYRMIYSKLNNEMYIPQYYAIKYLIDNFGKDKLLLLFKKYKKNMKKKEFEKKFYSVYNITYSQALNKIINNFDYEKGFS